MANLSIDFWRLFCIFLGINIHLFSALKIKILLVLVNWLLRPWSRWSSYSQHRVVAILLFWFGRFVLKLVSAIFYQIFIFNQMIALEKLWKICFISSKKLFLFLRYSNFCIFVFPSFFPVSHCFRSWLKKNLKVYDVINCLRP